MESWQVFCKCLPLCYACSICCGVHIAIIFEELSVEEFAAMQLHWRALRWILIINHIRLERAHQATVCTRPRPLYRYMKHSLNAEADSSATWFFFIYCCASVLESLHNYVLANCRRKFRERCRQVHGSAWENVLHADATGGQTRSMKHWLTPLERGPGQMTGVVKGVCVSKWSSEERVCIKKSGEK